MNYVSFRLAAVLAAMLFMTGPLTARAASSDALADRAETLVRQALKRMGGTAALDRAGGVTVEAEGTFDLAARLQGRHPTRPELTPIMEKITVDLAGNRLAYRLNWFNYQHSNQKLMEIFDAQGRVLYADLSNGSANWSAHPYIPDQAQRYRRLVPQLLLVDALEHSGMLEFVGTETVNGAAHHTVAYETEAGDRIYLYFDRRTDRFERASARFDMPVIGDATMSWRWSGYRRGPDGLWLPSRLTVQLAGQTLKSMRLNIHPGASDGDFAVPEGLEVPEPPAPKPWQAPTPASTAGPQVRDLGGGLHLVINLRPGFHVPFIEFADFVAVIDAPSIWYEMQHLPPMNWSAGDNSVALGKKLLRAVRQTLPHKPVQYLVLTHHHSDHIGGMRPFLDAGVTIVTGPQTAKVARRAALAPLSLAHYDGKPVASPAIEEVQKKRIITDGKRTLKLIALPEDNPQAEDFLIVWLPESKTLYTTAFIYPVPKPMFPLAESVNASKWFVRWLDSSGLDVKTHLNVHGQMRVQRWQIEEIRKLIGTEAAPG